MNTAPYKSLWVEILKKLEPTIQRSMLITWFKDTSVLGLDEGKLIVGLPLPMYLNWHLQNYRESILKAAQQINPAIDQIMYHVDLSLRDDETRTVNLLTLFPDRKPRKLPGKMEIKVGEGLQSRMFNPRYTLDSFVVGPSNRLAHAAAQAASAQPGGKYNPLFIYGGVGLGKTHLLQGVGHAYHHANPSAVVLYITSEEFTNQVIEAIRQQKIEGLRRKYRQVDMLIIDDVQFFASKERTQEEFFHTFNTLLEARKQVVVSSDRPPLELHSLLHDRLRSRFERGMIADVALPDYETRVAILQERAREYEIFFDQKVLSFIAEHVTDSVRSLEGILMQAVAQYELEQRIPTVNSIAEILCKLARDPHREVGEELIGFEAPPKRALKFEDLLEGVSAYYSISIQDITGTSRLREILMPRQVAMYLAKKYLRMSLSQLGERFSGRDHSTVIHSVRKIEKMMKDDPLILREVRAIEQEVGALR
ncbi:MAG TPA: chromosomal replication initiator protein DnaA [Candidatus Peribacterales bacterium]|nr:chromosomal replication initiator protein DnaA [Candidatus Peribacterales bacterium]